MKVIINPTKDEKCLYEAEEYHFNMMPLGTARRYCVASSDVYKAWNKQNNFVCACIHNVDKNVFKAEYIICHTFTCDEEALTQLPYLYPETPIVIIDMIAQGQFSLTVDIIPLFSLDVKEYPFLKSSIRQLFLDSIIKEYDVTVE